MNERTRLNFALQVDQIERLQRFYVQVAYTDVDGGQLRRTQIAVDGLAGRYEAVGFALYKGADGDLIVTSGTGWDVSLGERESW